MVERRTRALAELAIAVVTLLYSLFLRKYLREAAEEESGPQPLSSGGLAAGALSQGIYLWAYDRDVGHVRTNRRRGLLVGACRLLVRRRVLPRTESFRVSVRLGEMVGTVVYRLWYGLLRPLPGRDT
jgi:hypothetical protein